MKVKIFVTGRPEPHIRDGFRLLLLAEATDVFVLHGVEQSQVNSDVRLFFRHNLFELKGPRHVLGDWPTEGQMNLLCERSAGLFVHAMATIKFIDRKSINPRKRLDRLLQSLESSLEGRTELRENVTLDSLYMSILQGAFGVDDPEDRPDVRTVLGAVVLATDPLSPSSIAALLGFEAEDVFPLLSSMHSLLILHEDIDQPVRPFHKSFPDFITDPDRCTNSRFNVHPSDQHAKLLVGCLELMNRRLKQNMCQLPDGAINSEVEDLKRRAEQHIDKALEYACRSWRKHLVDKMPARTVESLHQFLTKKFLFWLEISSVIGVVREAVDALEATAKLLDVRLVSPLVVFKHLLGRVQASPTLDLARDYSRFVIAFFELISASAPHIYISALPLSPRASIVHKMYKQYACSSARVVHGSQILWDPVVATVYEEDFAGRAEWSPCGRFIAVPKLEAVEIRDAITLNLLSTFECPPNPQTLALRFSPDGRFFTQSYRKSMVTWDLQTGISVTVGPPEGLYAKEACMRFSLTYSVDGKMLAGEYWVEGSMGTCIATHDLSTTHTHVYRVSEGHVASPIWTQGEFLRFATVKSGYITIWQVDFTFTHPPELVEHLPAPDELIGGEAIADYLFLPTVSGLPLNSWMQFWSGMPEIRSVS